MQTEADGNLRVKVCSFNYIGNENVLSRVGIHRISLPMLFHIKYHLLSRFIVIKHTEEYQKSLSAL